MVLTVRGAFCREMADAREAYAAARYATAFLHLERAHILGQRHFIRHWITHWWMLKVGLRRRDRREIVGQILRLVAVVPGFVFGWVPKGNTGGANVSAVRPMGMPADLVDILGPYSIWRDVLQRLFLFALVALVLLGFYFGL